MPEPRVAIAIVLWGFKDCHGPHSVWQHVGSPHSLFLLVPCLLLGKIKEAREGTLQPFLVPTCVRRYCHSCLTLEQDSSISWSELELLWDKRNCLIDRYCRRLVALSSNWINCCRPFERGPAHDSDQSSRESTFAMGSH